MKKHLFLITVITLGLFNHASFSQDLSMLKNATYIFKGKVISFKAFKTKDDNTTLYASYIINITAIYKGENELKLGTIEIITKAPDSWAMTEDGILATGSNDDYYISHIPQFELAQGMTGIFFCNKKNNTEIFLTSVKCDNSIILEPICNTINCLFHFYNEIKIINENRAIEVPKIDGFGKKFNSEDELMEYLKKENIISSDKIIKKKDVEKLKSEINNVNDNKVDYAQRLKNYNNYMQRLQMRMQNASQNKSNSCKEFFISAKKINFTI